MLDTKSEKNRLWFSKNFFPSGHIVKKLSKRITWGKLLLLTKFQYDDDDDDEDDDEDAADADETGTGFSILRFLKIRFKR